MWVPPQSKFHHLSGKKRGSLELWNEATDIPSDDRITISSREKVGNNLQPPHRNFHNHSGTTPKPGPNPRTCTGSSRNLPEPCEAAPILYSIWAKSPKLSLLGKKWMAVPKNSKNCSNKLKPDEMDDCFAWTQPPTRCGHHCLRISRNSCPQRLWEQFTQLSAEKSEHIDRFTARSAAKIQNKTFFPKVEWSAEVIQSKLYCSILY